MSTTYRPSLAKHECSVYCRPEERVHHKIIEASAPAARNFQPHLYEAYKRWGWDVLSVECAEMLPVSHPALRIRNDISAYLIMLRVPEGWSDD